MFYNLGARLVNTHLDASIEVAVDYLHQPIMCWAPLEHTRTVRNVRKILELVRMIIASHKKEHLFECMRAIASQFHVRVFHLT